MHLVVVGSENSACLNSVAKYLDQSLGSFRFGFTLPHREIKTVSVGWSIITSYDRSTLFVS